MSWYIRPASGYILWRRFADQVGLSPKKFIRRSRLYEAAEAARYRASIGRRSR